MTKKEYSELKEGDVLRTVGGQCLVVAGMYGGYPAVVLTVDPQHLDMYEVVEKTKPAKSESVKAEPAKEPVLEEKSKK